MGLGISFSSAVIVGYIIREIVYLVSFNISANKLRSRTAGRIFQIIAVTILGVLLAPLTLDFVSIALSGVYIILLLLDIWVAERVLQILQKTKDTIVQSPITKSVTKYVLDTIEPHIAKIRRARLMNNDNSIQPRSTTEAVGTSSTTAKVIKTPSKIIIIVQNIFVFSLKIVVYQVLVRTVVLGASISLLHIIEKTSTILIDHFLDALIGPIGTHVGHGCNMALIKVPRIVLEWIRDMLDLLFGGWHILNL